MAHETVARFVVDLEAVSGCASPHGSNEGRPFVQRDIFAGKLGTDTC